MSAPEPAATRAPDARALRRILLAAGAVFAALFVLGVVPRIVLRSQLQGEADAARARLPLVSTANPQRAPEVLDVPLPGSMEPILVTGIWARTDGYLKARYVDIGDRVTKGQLLAEIETPELDQELLQAVALVAQDQANVVKFQADLALDRTTLERYLAAGLGAVSQQQIDVAKSAVTDAEKTVDAARATVNADEANAQHWRDLQSFQKVYAPFDGVITSRTVDFGALVSAGSTTGTTELFTIAQVDVLRIFVYVPQSYALDIKPDQTAEVSVRQLADRVFQGKVTRTAGAIDPTSRTLLTEVQVPNPDGLLLSGSYATVRFKIQQPDPPLLIPQTAVLIDASGVRVALVEADGTLHYQPIQVGRNYGEDVEVLSGLDPNDVIATGIAANIVEGSHVEMAKPAATPAVGAAKP